MVTSKSRLARMLAVIMVSATLMSAVPAQAGAADVGKKVKSALYGTGRVAGLAVNGVYLAFGIKGIIFPNNRVGKRKGLAFLCASIPTVITLCKSLKNGDKEVGQEEIEMSAVPAQTEAFGIGKRARRALYGTGRVAGLTLNGITVVQSIKVFIFPDLNVDREVGLFFLSGAIPTVITLCKSLINGDKEVGQKEKAAVVDVQ